MAGVIERYASSPPAWAAEPRRITSASGRTFDYLPYIFPVDAIAFTQTSVSIVTSKSSKKQSSLAQLVAELLTGHIPLESMELDDVTVAGPRLWSCNNRRLCILKCYQEASRRLQVLLYGRVPAALHLLPYVQIRVFIQVDRDPWMLRDIGVETARCPGHKLSRQDWETGKAVDFSSSQMRIAEAAQTVSRGTQQKPFFLSRGLCAGDSRLLYPRGPQRRLPEVGRFCRSRGSRFAPRSGAGTPRPSRDRPRSSPGGRGTVPRKNASQAEEASCLLAQQQ